MSADVDICNIALSHLGDDANIAALNENSTQAAYCKTFYPLARDAVLQRGGFGFTLRRLPLAQDLITVPAQWLYAYSTPNNCLRKIAVLPPDAPDDTNSVSYAVEALDDAGNEVIYTNIQSATLRYVQRVSDTTKYTPLVVMAMARLLAAFLAGPLIKGDTGMQIGIKQMEIFDERSFPQALASDANSQQTDHYADFIPSGLKARGGSSAVPVWPGPLSSFP